MRHRSLILRAAFVCMALGITGCSSSGTGGSPPSGNLTVRAQGKVVCVIKITNGKGSCKVGTAQYTPGTVQFSAAFPGSKEPAKATVTVTKSTSTTTLSLTATTVKYGAEQSERLSVVVAPHIAGTPTGKVTLRTGSTVVCVITLASGKGSCALTASQLPSGNHPIVASYAGSPSFTGSSGQRMLTVIK